MLRSFAGMEVVTKEEHYADMLKVWEQIKQLIRKVDIVESNQSEWVSQEEACKLAGRSRAWFSKMRDRDELPIAMQPRDKDSGRIFYKRSDCIKFAQDKGILPPPTL